MSAFDAAKKLLEAGQDQEALAAVRAALPGAEYLAQVAGARIAGRLLEREKVKAGLQPVRLALLGSSTTAQLAPLLSLHGLAAGLALDIYEGPFGTYQQQILDPSSALYAFKPQAALLFVNYRDAEPGPAEAEADRWAGLWKALRERAGCAVLMSNFDTPVERPSGNLEAGLDEGLGRLRRLNDLLARRAREAGALIVDQEHLSSVFGKERWHDARFWQHARQSMALAALPRYAAEAVAVLKAAFGKSCKCLALDLDNTLWGGVVGDDGAEGVELTEPYLELQRYAKALKERGVLLAVVSKNDPEIARAAFKRPEMVLKLEDIAVFVANWEDKATNLRAVAKALNIGLDAVAFADDNPTECELVSRFAPEVSVVSLGEDPAEFVRALDSRRLFEPAAVSEEDRARAAHFHAEARREALKAQAPDLGSFLRGLEMRAVAGPFEERDVARIAQLINKTNQFNLTTRRYTEAQVRAFMADPAVTTLAVRLTDRLGDYGLISVAIARKEGAALEIDSWLMSCRVLGRGVESLVFNRLVEAARQAGASELSGRYLPTPKNGLVKGLLAGFGFRKDGDSWRLPVAAAKRVEVSIDDGSAAAA